MRDETPDRDLPPRTRRVVRWVLVVAGIVAWSYALFGSEGLLRQWQALRERNRLAEQLEHERRINQELEAEIERLRDDDLTIERYIRTELDYQRPGETVFILEGDEAEEPRFAKQKRQFDNSARSR